jgi:hypothetical protein
MYVSGAALSAGVLALPDIGLFTLTELVQQVQYLTARITIPVIVDAVPLYGDGGAITGAIAVQQDITPLQEMDKLRNEFLGMVTHESDASHGYQRLGSDGPGQLKATRPNPDPRALPNHR